MRFVLIDRILEFEKGKRIKAVKALSLAEEYLKDHFPQRPILPGVLMLEALIQAGAWLVRVTRDFQVGALILSGAKNLRFVKFVAPGETLTIELQWSHEEGGEVELAGKGVVGEESVIAAKICLRPLDLGRENPRWGAQEKALRALYRTQFEQIYRPVEVPV